MLSSPRESRAGVLPGPILDALIDWAHEEQIQTPVLLLSAAALRAGVGELRGNLGARISYATKANAHPRVLATLEPLVDDFNVTNLVHLDALRALGTDPSRIIFLHPVATPATLAAVAQAGVRRFVIDDHRGLRLLAATGLGDLRVTLRLLPPDSGESERSVVRFGNTAAALRELAADAAEAGIEIEGLSFFVGTAGVGMPQAAPYRGGIDQLSLLHEQLRDDGISVPTVNVGGGFPGSRRRFHLRHPDFFARIERMLDDGFPAGTQYVCEPGRYLSEPSMLMLSRVVADRVVAGRRFVHVDASAYAGLFETSFIEAGGESPAIALLEHERPPAPADVLGPVMDSFDVVKRGTQLPPLEEAQLLLLPNLGAYSVGFSTVCEGLRAPAVIEIPEQLDRELAATWYD